MDILGILGIVMGILTIILFITKKFNVIIAAPIATISISNKILSVVGTKNPFNALVALFIISAILTYGGINVFVIIFALIPMAKPIFRKLNISWKLVTIPVFGGTSTFTMTMLPGAPSLHNIVPSMALGTTLTAGPVIGIVTSIVSIVFLLVFMKLSLSKSLRNKETFHLDEEIKSIDGTSENKQLPSFIVSLLPILTLLGIILLFSSVNNIIIVALLVAIVMSAILFRKQIAHQKELLSQGANESLSSTITTGSTIAFASITTSVPAFMGVFQLIQSIPGPPVLSLMIGTGLIGGITASSVGAIGIAINNFAPAYLAMGINPETIHRTITIASGALSIVPYSGFLIIFNKITGLSMKDTFKNGFISISVTHWIAMAIIVSMALLGLA